MGELVPIDLDGASAQCAKSRRHTLTLGYMIDECALYNCGININI